MKIAINTCFGGFGLSDAAYEKLIEYGVPVAEYKKDLIPDRDEKIIFRGGLSWREYWDSWTDRERNHPLLIRVIEELGEKANGDFACLKVVEIPDGVDYEICDYDGAEHVAEKHRTWS